MVSEPETTTDSNVCRIEAKLVFSPIPAEYTEVDGVMKRYESDPKRAAALARARLRISDAVVVKGKPTLASLRLGRGLSQVSLANSIGTSQSRLSRIETGLDDILHSTFEKLVGALDVSRDQLAEALANKGEE